MSEHEASASMEADAASERAQRLLTRRSLVARDPSRAAPRVVGAIGSEEEERGLCGI